MSKKIALLDTYEFQEKIIDFFNFTQEISENFYTKYNIKYKNYNEIESIFNEKNYLFLTSLHGDSGSLHFVYQKYKIDKDYDKLFPETFNDLKSVYPSDLKKEFIIFLNKFDFYKNKDNLIEYFSFLENENDVKNLINYLIYEYLLDENTFGYMIPILFYFYLIEEKKSNYLKYFYKKSIKIFKINSFLNIIPFRFNLKNFYQLGIINNIYYSALINYFTILVSKKISFEDHLKNYLTKFLLIFDKPIFLELRDKKDFMIVNAKDLVLQRLQNIENINFLQKNFNLLGLFYSFEDLKNMVYKSFKNLNIKKQKELINYIL